MKPAILFVWATLVVCFLTACCPCPPEDKRPLPPPLPREAHLQALAARAALIPALKARGTVKLAWTDDQGSHSHTADGVLLARSADAHGRPRRDAYLVGRVAGQDAFEVGANEQWEWLAFPQNKPKTAYIAPADDAAEFHVRFRAARVLDILALTPLNPTSTLYTVDDRPARSTLYAVRWQPNPIPAAGEPPAASVPPFIERLLLIDRRAPAGQVTEVRLYLPSGLLEAVAQLSDYAPVLSAEGEPLPTAARLPRRIVIDYPAQKAHIELTLESLTLANPANARPYELPDFKSQGFEDKNIIQAFPPRKE